VKLMIRNTSRDKTTAAMRKARPGDVQPNPTIKKVRLPPGGSLSVDPHSLSDSDARLVQKLMGCGCLRVFAVKASGPMRPIDAAELGEMCNLQAAPTPAPPSPAPPEPKPPVVEAVEPEPEPEPEVIELEEDSGPVPYLSAELKSMKNSKLRSILFDMDYGRTTGMNKSALVAAILEMQES
jgi:hypothetical protein